MLARTPSLNRYVATTAVIVLTGALWLAGAAVVRTTAFLTVFPLTILVVAARFGMGPAVASALGGVLAYFLLVPPTLSFAVHEGRDALALALTLAVATIASLVVEQLRQRVRNAQEQAGVERLRNGV